MSIETLTETIEPPPVATTFERAPAVLLSGIDSGTSVAANGPSGQLCGGGGGGVTVPRFDCTHAENEETRPYMPGKSGSAQPCPQLTMPARIRPVPLGTVSGPPLSPWQESRPP